MRAETQQAIRNINAQTADWIDRLSQHPNCAAARSLGTIGAVEKRDLPSYGSSVSRKIRDFALEQGVLLRPLGPVLYAVPPYCMKKEEVDLTYQVIEQILDGAF